MKQAKELEQLQKNQREQLEKLEKFNEQVKPSAAAATGRLYQINLLDLRWLPQTNESSPLF